MGDIPAQVSALIGTYLESARLIGESTAALHKTLASEVEDHGFTPEPFTPHVQRGLFQSMRNTTRRNLQLLNARFKSLPADIQAQAQPVLGLESKILDRLRSIYERRLDAARIRCHGDYHLGQLLYTGKDFLIIDFEGEPATAISERRLKHSPLRDVAGMIRSFYYAAYAGLRRQGQLGALQAGNRKQMEAWARFWSRWVSADFYATYREAAGAASFLPASNADLQLMMDAYLLQKAVYELGYELNNRPDWAGIPLQAIVELVNPENTP